MRERTLTLETSWSRSVIHNPSREDISRAVEQLREDENSIILSQADEDYIQATPGAMEYRREGRHFRFETQPSDRSYFKRVFISYVQNEPFSGDLAWQDVTEEVQRDVKRAKVIKLSLIGAVIMVALWMTLRR